MKHKQKTRIQALEQTVIPHSGEVYQVEYTDGSIHNFDGHNTILAAIAGDAVAVSPDNSFADAIIRHKHKGKEE
ncbi:MAG: hypothetical protein E7439_02270 [Ruminococcaceae bacterium]|nr:hypothetical protein [Oscillospiraceae bacterium]